MKKKALMMGICLGTLILPASSLFAQRSNTAFSSFHVQSAKPLTARTFGYDCITEDNGAAVNNCKYEVNMLFNVILDSPGTKSISVQNYWKMPTAFGCVAYVYNGTGGFSLSQTPINFTAAGQIQTVSVDVPEAGDTVQVICFTMPEGDGIASLNWTP